MSEIVPKMAVHFSSASGEWETPQQLFEELDREFHFTLDAAANRKNAKCEAFYPPEVDALLQPWPGMVWCNPPYGRQIGRWVQKGWEESQGRGKRTVVMLLPARTDTRWWHDYVMRSNDIRFIKGRLKFGGHKNSAPFPSVIVVFRGKYT